MATPPQPAASAPSRWTTAILRAVLPGDAMGDTITGDLHEEFTRDLVRLGAAQASARHRRRAASVIMHAVVDAACWRAWGSTPSSGEARGAVASPGTPVLRNGRVGGGDVGLGALALVVLLAGIVANTILFGAARRAPHAAAARASSGSAVGASAIALAFGCAGVSALLLCAGPRWIRRRRAAQAHRSTSAIRSRNRSPR